MPRPVIVSPPEPIAADHDVSQFRCEQPALDEWLRRQALRNEGLAGRTYVVCVERAVVGYYCLATAAAGHGEVNAKLRRNMPDPIPMILLGRLAVDRAHQGAGIGSGLLKDAIRRAAAAYRIVGFRALVVHAKDDAAVAFYEKHGFKALASARTLFLPMETLVAGL